MCGVRIGVGDGEAADGGRAGIFVKGRGGEGDSGRGFVDVGDVDADGANEGFAAGVGGGEVEVDGGLGFVVDGGGISEFEGVGDDFKAGIGGGEAVGGIVRIGDDDASDGGARGFGDGVVGEEDGSGRIVYRGVSDGTGGRAIGAPCGVRNP